MLTTEVISTVNMKYTLEYCLFYSNSSTPSLPRCEADCAGLSPVLLSSWFSPSAAKQYDYCSINNTAFPQYVDQCASCLQAGTGSVVLGNFLDAMQSACESQPDATLGETVPLKRELFNTTTVGTSTGAIATASSTFVSTTGTQATSTSPSPSPSSSSSSTTGVSAPAGQTAASNHSGLSTGAAAGVGVACGLGAITIIGALGWFMLTRRRRNNDRNQKVNGLDLNETKAALSSPYLGTAQAQQLGSSEVYEIGSTLDTDSRTNELDGRPVH